MKLVCFNEKIETERTVRRKHIIQQLLLKFFFHIVIWMWIVQHVWCSHMFISNQMQFQRMLCRNHLLNYTVLQTHYNTFLVVPFICVLAFACYLPAARFHLCFVCGNSVIHFYIVSLVSILNWFHKLISSISILLAWPQNLMRTKKKRIGTKPTIISSQLIREYF